MRKAVFRFWLFANCLLAALITIQPARFFLGALRNQNSKEERVSSEKTPLLISLGSKLVPVVYREYENCSFQFQNSHFSLVVPGYLFYISHFPYPINLKISQISRFPKARYRAYFSWKELRLWRKYRIDTSYSTSVLGSKNNSTRQKLERVFSFILWLAPWAGKTNQIARCDWLPERARWSYLPRSGLTAVSREKKIPREPNNKSHIDQAFSVNMARYWPLLFCEFMDHAKENLANIQPSWPKKLGQ